MVESKAFHRAWMGLEPASGRAVGLGQHQHQDVPARKQRRKRARGKIGRAGKDEFHGVLETGASDSG
jgi:hypothetical protein